MTARLALDIQKIAVGQEVGHCSSTAKQLTNPKRLRISSVAKELECSGMADY